MVVAGPNTEQLVGRAGGTRRADDLRELAAHPSPKVRRIVAANPATPVDVLDALLADGQESVRQRAVANPATPVASIVARGVLADRPDRLARALADRTLTPEDLHVLARATPLPYRALAARSPSLLPDDVRHLAAYDDLVGDLAATHRLPGRAFTRATRRCDMATIEAIAGSPHLGPIRRWWLTDGLIGERKHVARRVIAAHDGTSRLQLHRLRWRTTWMVKRALVRRDAVSRATLRWWARHGPDGLRDAVAASPRTPAGSLSALVHMSATCRIAAARNPSLPPELARRLAGSNDPWIAGTAMGNPNLPVEDIERLASDTSLHPWQLRQLALNPSCAAGTREQLLTWLSLGGAGAGDPLFTPDDRGAGRLPFGSWDEVAPHLHAHSAVGMFRARAVSTAGTLDQRDLRVLVTDPSPAVRYAAAGYMNGASLQVLAYDEDPQVRRRVAATYQEASRRRVNLRAPGVEQDAVRRRRQTGSVIALGLLLAAGSAGTLFDQLGDRSSNAGTPPLPTFLLDAEDLAELGVTSATSTASIRADPSRPNGAIVDVTLGDGSSVVLVTGASLCEELGTDGFGAATVPITYCDTPGPVTLEIRGIVPQTIVLDPPAGLAP